MHQNWVKLSNFHYSYHLFFPDRFCSSICLQNSSAPTPTIPSCLIKIHLFQNSHSRILKPFLSKIHLLNQIPFSPKFTFSNPKTALLNQIDFHIHLVTICSFLTFSNPLIICSIFAVNSKRNYLHHIR